MPLGRHRLDDDAERLALLEPQPNHLANRFLLALVADELAAVRPAAPEAERDNAAKVAPPRPLVGLRLPDALADAVALRFREGGGDRQEQLGQAVARDVAAQVQKVEVDAALFERGDNLERVEG